MRALVLGGTGHIGAHVCHALARRGYAVRATYRNPRYRFVLDDAPVERIQLDVTDRPALQRALEGCELVFHCAGFYPSLTRRRVEAVAEGLAQIRAVFDVLRTCGPRRILFTSSAATIRSLPDRPATEADREPWPPTEWRGLYATVKIAMEREVERYAAEGLPIVITHPSICLGEHDAHPFSGRLILAYASGRVPITLHHAISVVYTGDVGEASVSAAERGQPGGHYNLTARNLMLTEFARDVARLAGARPPHWELPRPIELAAAATLEAFGAVRRQEPIYSRAQARQSHTRRHWLDASRAIRELGMPQTPIDEAVRRALAWFRRHGIR